MTPISPKSEPGSDHEASVEPVQETNPIPTWESTFQNYPTVNHSGEFSADYYYPSGHSTQTNGYDLYRSALSNTFYQQPSQTYPSEPYAAPVEPTEPSLEPGSSSLTPISSQIVESNYLLTGVEPLAPEPQGPQQTYSSTETPAEPYDASTQPTVTYTELDYHKK